jgi:hypothetical protein
MIGKKVLLIMCLAIAGLVVNCNPANGNGNNNNTPTPTPTLNGRTPMPSPMLTPTPNRPLSITAPADNEQVVELPFVEGTVSDSTAKVWVIVHPMEVAGFWVQPAVTVREGGKWKVQIHIGRPGNVDVGKHFEIMAVANPKNSLKEGDILKGWAEAQWKSQVIEVIRK